MMGHEKPPQPSLFYRFNLEQRVPADHPLRAIAAIVDFDFICDQVEELYGGVGNPSVPPPSILKLMFLLAYENMRSERALFAALGLRLDWLWFLGMDLDSSIPDHSVVSKARARWGAEAFRCFFESVLQQAIDAGLIDGTRIFCDGSLFEANASRKSVETVQVVDLSAVSAELERRLDESKTDGQDDHAEVVESRDDVPAESSEEPSAPVKTERRSTTDPDAAVVTKPGAGAARPRYKAHRAIDDRHGVITATTVTPGDVDEGHELFDLINQHEHNTDSTVEVVVADTQYGTTENYLMCLDRAITPRMRLLSEQNDAQRKDGLFRRSEFCYHESNDTYTCPAGKELRRLQIRADRAAVRYGPEQGECLSCELRDRCTSGQSRSITRHLRQNELDSASAELRTEAGRRDLRKRHHFMERSFAVGVRFGFKKCRWRGLERAEIHELLVATTQNIDILVRNWRRKAREALAAVSALPQGRAGARETSLCRLLLSLPIAVLHLTRPLLSPT
jgi:transposase